MHKQRNIRIAIGHVQVIQKLTVVGREREHVGNENKTSERKTKHEKTKEINNKYYPKSRFIIIIIITIHHFSYSTSHCNSQYSFLIIHISYMVYRLASSEVTNAKMSSLKNPSQATALLLPFVGSMTKSENLVAIARLSEKAERYEDMASAMKLYAETGTEMSDEDRMLLSIAYKNVVGVRRTAWRTVNEARHMNIDQGNKESEELNQLVATYMDTIETELRKYCMEVLDILDQRIETQTHCETESKVCFLKMRGDYQRYLCEICTGSERKLRADEAMVAYKSALDEANILLPPTHPLRLGLQLNYSVFCYEVMDQCERAVKIARAAFTDALAELDTMPEETYRDSTIILQLLRDNIQLWTSRQSLEQSGNLLTTVPTLLANS